MATGLHNMFTSDTTPTRLAAIFDVPSTFLSSERDDALRQLGMSHQHHVADVYARCEDQEICRTLKSLTDNNNIYLLQML